MPETRQLAETALRIHDDRGEFAMVVFMMAHAFPDQPQHNWLHDGICILNDQSMVVHGESHYSYRYCDLFGNHQTAYRRAVMEDHQRPRFETRHRPILHQPNFQNIWNEVMARVESTLDTMQDAPLLDIPTSYLVAPSFHDAPPANASYPPAKRIYHVEQYDCTDVSPLPA